MECVIPNKFIKLFAKSIQCLAKIGDELYIEATHNKLIFRTLNPARSAFFAFTLDRAFFEEYFLEDGIPKKFSVKLKSCLAVFKQFEAVEKCCLKMDEVHERFVFELQCKHGIKKLYKLTYDEMDPIKAVYDKENAMNKMVFSPKKIAECISNFYSKVEHISFLASKEGILLKSFVDDSPVSSTSATGKPLRTEMHVDVGDFDEYEIGQETCITFDIKQFKAILSFCDSAGQPVSMYFERGGRPILLALNYFGSFQADFVLASLLEDAPQPSENVSTGSTSSTTPSSKSSSFSSSNQSFNKTPITNKSSTPYSGSKATASSYRNDPRSPDNSSPIPSSSSPSVITSGSQNSPPRSANFSKQKYVYNPNNNSQYVQGRDEDEEDEDAMDYEVPASPPYSSPRAEKVRSEIRNSAKELSKSNFPDDEGEEEDYEVPSSFPEK